MMEQFAVIGLATQEKKAEAEAILKELGYSDNEEWNEKRRTKVDRKSIITYKGGDYEFYSHEGILETPITLDQLRAKLKPKQMENVVVKVLNKEHGKEVIQAFKDLGVDTGENVGSSIGYYYGLIEGDFGWFSNHKNSKVITLEELKAMKREGKPTYPCMMEVWNDFEEPEVRQVIADFKTPKGHDMYVAISEEGYDSYCWQHARPIQPDPLKEVVENMNGQIDTDKAYNKFDGDYKSWEEMRGVLLTPNEAQLIIDALEKIEK
jgi:hypothetical protein